MGKLNKALTVFSPRQKHSKIVQYSIILGWLTIALVLWQLWLTNAIPKPLEVLRAFPDLWTQGEAVPALLTSVQLDIEAICCLTVIALLVSYASVTSAGKGLATLFSWSRFNGAVGLPLLFTLILKNPHYTKVALLVWGTSGFTIPSLVTTINEIPTEEYGHAKTLRFGKWRTIWEVVVLGTRDRFIDVLSTNYGMIWFLVPMVEGMFRYEGGIGPLTLDANKHLNLSVVYALSVLVVLVGMGQDYLLTKLKATLCPYVVTK